LGDLGDLGEGEKKDDVSDEDDDLILAEKYIEECILLEKLFQICFFWKC
jgi:hypothetical protein